MTGLSSRHGWQPRGPGPQLLGRTTMGSLVNRFCDPRVPTPPQLPIAAARGYSRAKGSERGRTLTRETSPAIWGSREALGARRAEAADDPSGERLECLRSGQAGVGLDLHDVFAV